VRSSCLFGSEVHQSGFDHYHVQLYKVWLSGSCDADLVVASTTKCRGTLEAFEHVVDCPGERPDICRVDRGERCDAKLIATELSVGLGVDHSILAQRLGDR